VANFQKPIVANVSVYTIFCETCLLAGTVEQNMGERSATSEPHMLLGESERETSEDTMFP